MLERIKPGLEKVSVKLMENNPNGLRLGETLMLGIGGDAFMVFALTENWASALAVGVITIDTAAKTFIADIKADQEKTAWVQNSFGDVKEAWRNLIHRSKK